LLLGHEDIASLFALNLLADGLREHHLTAFMSGELAAGEPGHAALAELAAIDRDLCAKYLQQAEMAEVLVNAEPLAKPNSEEGLAAVRALTPDLVISVRYRRILHDAAIAIPRLGVLNLHSGILPDYRGVMATFWAMLKGEKQIGTTLHWIVDAGIDTGPVIEIRRRRTRRNRTYLANVLGLYPDACAGILAIVDKLESGDAAQTRRQVPGSGYYFSTPDHAAVASFLAEGLVLAHGKELEQQQR
jgi:methionyl-tRNA formyltransferase